MFDNDTPIIHRYGREEAIADGLLVDVTEMAQSRGFTAPVALTASVHSEFVKVPAGVEGQDESGRLWDILHMLAHAIRSARGPGNELLFRLYVRNDNKRARLVTLKCISGPGDHGEHVLTVLLPDED